MEIKKIRKCTVMLFSVIMGTVLFTVGYQRVCAVEASSKAGISFTAPTTTMETTESTSANTKESLETVETKKQEKSSVQQNLPKTGEKKTNRLFFAGVFILGILFVFMMRQRKKKKE